MADSSILRLTKELVWIEREVLPALSGLRTGQHTLFDRIFANELAIAVHSAHEVCAAQLADGVQSYACPSLHQARFEHGWSAAAWHLHDCLQTTELQPSCYGCHDL